MNILLIAREPNSYNNDLYNAFESSGIQLLVIHLISNSNNNATWTENFKRKYSHEIVTSVFKQLIVLPKRLMNNYSAVIIAGWATPGCVIAIMFCLLFRKKFFIWADTVPVCYPRKLFSRILRSPIRYLAITKSSAILTTGKPGRASLERLGCHPSKIVDFPYTVDQKKLINDAACITAIVKNIIEQSAKRPIIFYAGQLIFRKGLDILLRAIRSVVDGGIEVFPSSRGRGTYTK